MRSLERLAIDWVEQGRIHDGLVRLGIRQLCRRRLDLIAAADCEAVADARQAFVAEMLAGPVAPVPDSITRSPPPFSTRSWGRGANTVAATSPLASVTWPPPRTPPWP